jgi:hypothetical protein
MKPHSSEHGKHSAVDVNRQVLGITAGSFADSLWTALSTNVVSPSPTHGLPLPRLAVQLPDSTTYYVVTTIDSRGRLADRSPLLLLQWRPGHRLAISAAHGAGVVIILAQRNGHHVVTHEGRIRLPLPVRRLCRLNPGDRMLLAACPERSLLTAYTMHVIDAMVLAYHRAHPGGVTR